MRLWREARFEVKWLKAPQPRNAFGSWTVEKVPAAVAPSANPSQNVRKKTLRSELFGRWTVIFIAGAMDLALSQKWAKNEFFFWISKRWQEWDVWRGSADALGSRGIDYLRGVAFWNIESSGSLRWLCVTGAALRMTGRAFSWQARHLRQMGWKSRNHNAAGASGASPTFHFCGTSPWIALF